MLLALSYTYLSNLQIAIWLAVILPLDGIDGFLARKRNEQTNMGAYFDMETDVFFVCMVSCILFIRGLTGYEVLVAAFFRYFYVFIVNMLGLHYIKEQRTKIGPIVAVYVFIALTLAFIVPDKIRATIIYSALTLLVMSFTYSFSLLLSDNRKHKVLINKNKG
jgi:phosphatidylglycerophosphate synthase